MILKRSLHLDITYHVSQLNEAPSNAVFALPTRSASSHVVGCIYYLFLCVCPHVGGLPRSYQGFGHEHQDRRYGTNAEVEFRFCWLPMR